MNLIENLYLQQTYLNNIYEELIKIKNKINDIDHDKISFSFSKEKYMQDLNIILNNNFVNMNTKIKQDILSLLKIFKIKYDISNILCYQNMLEIMEIYSKTISDDLWIQYLITRDDKIIEYRSKINYFNFSIKDNLDNITTLFVAYEKIMNYYDKIKNYGNLKFLNFDLSKIHFLIYNLNEFESHLMKINENIDCSIYYMERQNDTIKTWKTLKNEFFEIDYHQSLFKKIVLDEKEVSIFT